MRYENYKFYLHSIEFIVNYNSVSEKGINMKEKDATIEAITKINILLSENINYKDIEEILCDYSNLPGPRGNLTLAYKFADYFKREDISDEFVNILFEWAELSLEDAPINTPQEYLPYCAVVALGTHYKFAKNETKERISTQLRISANDKRWRTREGVAMGLQQLAEIDFNPVRVLFSIWMKDANYLEKRAIIATLAHPPILKDYDIARYSLDISDRILNDVFEMDIKDTKEEEFKVLSKGLQYAISVFVAHMPDDGFELLMKFAGMKNKELKKIIKSNLGKARIAKKFPEKVQTVSKVLINQQN